MSLLNHKFYKDSFEKHGVSAKGVHWNSKESQNLRFEIITDLIEDISSSSIIDLGCGFADFLTYLEKKKLKPNIYLGIDCEKFMIEIARERYPNNIFLKANLFDNNLPQADYYICSGTLNIFNSKEFLVSIKKCFSHVNKALIFNCLTEKSMHNLEIEEIFSFCKTLTTQVSIEDNYLHNDVTFLLEK